MLNTDNRCLNLILDYGPLGLVRAVNARIGRDSILVDTGCIVLCDNSEVGIVLSIRDGNQRDTHHIRARVSGRDGDSCKLAFQECTSATLKALMPFVTAHH